jgi:ATP-dependent Lon protease
MPTPTGLADSTRSLLLPVLPLGEVCLFPEASLAVVVSRPGALKAVEIALRSGGRVLALASKESGDSGDARDLHMVGTIAEIRSSDRGPDGTVRVELDGQRRARAVEVFGTQALVAEVGPLDEGDAGDEWGAAVEALARYLHAHADLRSFLEQQRRSAEAMSWVNLACQHLPITATARQKLLESDAHARCLRISRGLDALLRKEHAS